MTPEQLIIQLQRKISQTEDLINKTMPIKAGAIAVSHFRDNFHQGGFINGGLHKWKPANRLNKTISGKRRNRIHKTRASRIPADNRYKTLLSSRPHLFNSIKYIPSAGMVRIVNEVPYAIVHNQGLKAGRGRGFQMPKRQFIGESK